MGLIELQRIRQQRDIPKPKKIHYIAKVSAKRKEKMKQMANNDENLDKWFEERRKEMKGRCSLCGGKTLKDNDAEYRRSIHHLFEKRKTMFPSVALHPDNFLEVCFYGNSCHTQIHNGKITWQLLMDSAEKEMILEKVKKILPYISENEQKNIPEILLKELQ